MNPGTTEMHIVAALDEASVIHPVLTLFEGVATGATTPPCTRISARSRKPSTNQALHWSRPSSLRRSELATPAATAPVVRSPVVRSASTTTGA